MPVALLFGLHVLSLFARLLRLTTGDGGEEPKPERTKAGDLVTQYNGDAVRMADKLAEVLDDNFKLRRKRDDLQRERDEARGKVPAEGALVLSADDAKMWEAYRALNLPPDAIKAAVEERDTVKAELTTARRDSVIRDAAQASGFKFGVLKDRLGELPVELRDVTENGQTTKRAFVKDTNGRERVLVEWAEQDQADYLPALKAAGQAQTGGVQIPGQQGSAQASGDRVAAFIEQTNKERDARPNPLGKAG